jgi:two-component system, NtrC family, nitrogen regulation sensor histidine kinase GlnL
MGAGGPSADDIWAVSPNATLIIDGDDVISRANAAAEVLLNISAQMMIGQKLGHVLHLPASYIPGHDAAFAAYDSAFATMRGVRFRADMMITPFPDYPGWRVVALHSGAAAERVGHRLEGGSGARAAVRIAASLAHEIKNPLAGIKGAAQLLGRSGDNSSKQLTHIIAEEVDRVAAMIDRMEGFTDPPPPEVKPENIHAILDHARAVAMSGFGDRIDITDSYDPSLPPVLAHRDTLVQVLLNLLKNAAETVDGAQKRRVTMTTAFKVGVAVSHDTGKGRRSLPIEVCVIDDGPGAMPDIVDALFEPFVTTKPKGHGLGLALVDKLIRDMGGIIQYAREGAPEHTVFRILLPRADKNFAEQDRL